MTIISCILATNRMVRVSAKIEQFLGIKALKDLISERPLISSIGIIEGCLSLWVPLALPFPGYTDMKGFEVQKFGAQGIFVAPLQKNRETVSLSSAEVSPKELLAGNNERLSWQVGSNLNLRKSRTNSVMVASIMALLATFDAAQVLPQEGSAQANQLIHALIQFQSALFKSQAPELRHYLLSAIESELNKEAKSIYPSILEKGLTTQILEALLNYDQKVPIWDQPELSSILLEYNLSQSDWLIIKDVFYHAAAAYGVKGASIHTAYEEWRLQM